MSPTEYTMHSGGAYGSDISWEIIGREYGLTEFYHYYYGSKTPYGNKCISYEQFLEGKAHVLQANKFLKRKPNKYMNILSRNWQQVCNSDIILAIGNLKDPYEVDGGTGWAVQMSIDSNKPVYVFDLGNVFKNHWCKFSYDQFIPVNSPPVLERNFAGIGTRNINTYGLNAIREVYENTFNNKILKL